GHERAELIRGHPDAAVAERHRLAGLPLDLERERSVERLALASLVVRLPGDELVRSEEQRDREEERGAAQRARAERGQEARAGGPPEDGKERPRPERQRDEQVVRLRIRRDAEEDGREERPLAPPGGEPGRDHAEVEDLGREPEEVDRRDR